MRRSNVGWRICLQLDEITLIDRDLGDEHPVTVGERPRDSFIIPGVRGGATLLDGDRLCLPSGMSGILRRSTSPQPSDLLETACLRVGDEAELWPSEHPQVRLRVRRVLQERTPFPRLRWSVPLRELLAMASLAAVVAIIANTTTAGANVKTGGEGSDSRLARLMFSATPMQTTEPQESTPAVAFEQRQAGAPQAGPAAAPQPLAATHGQHALANGQHASGGHSHSSHGGSSATPEHGSGTAVHAPEPPCNDPTIEPKAQVDVVFVVDVSTTMRFALDALAREIQALDVEVRKLDRSPHYGLVVFVDDVLVVGGGVPHTDIGALRREFESWANFTASNQQLLRTTDNLDWPENSLDALHAAATTFAWRSAKDTIRLVVHATDDDFREKGAVLSGHRVEHSYAETVEALVREQVRVATFAARIGGECECEDVTPGLLAAYGSQPSIPVASGGAGFDIDEVASGRLSFTTALLPLLHTARCRL